MSLRTLPQPAAASTAIQPAGAGAGATVQPAAATATASAAAFAVGNLVQRAPQLPQLLPCCPATTPSSTGCALLKLRVGTSQASSWQQQVAAEATATRRQPICVGHAGGWLWRL